MTNVMIPKQPGVPNDNKKMKHQRSFAWSFQLVMAALFVLLVSVMLPASDAKDVGQLIYWKMETMCFAKKDNYLSSKSRGIRSCNVSLDITGTCWPETLADTVSRRCRLDGIWEKPNTSLCEQGKDKQKGGLAMQVGGNKTTSNGQSRKGLDAKLLGVIMAWPVLIIHVFVIFFNLYLIRFREELFNIYNSIIVAFILHFILHLISYYTDILTSNNLHGCNVVWILTRYLIAAEVCWLLNLTIFHQNKVKKPDATSDSYFSLYSLFGWGFPSFITICGFVTMIEIAGDKNRCWYEYEQSLYMLMLQIPLALVITINVVLILYVICVLRRGLNNLQSSNIAYHRNTRCVTMLLVFVAPLMDAGYLMMSLPVEDDAAGYQYMLNIVPATQGLLLLMLLLLNPEARFILSRRWRLKRGKGTYTDDNNQDCPASRDDNQECPASRNDNQEYPASREGTPYTNRELQVEIGEARGIMKTRHPRAKPPSSDASNKGFPKRTPKVGPDLPNASLARTNDRSAGQPVVAWEGGQVEILQGTLPKNVRFSSGVLNKGYSKSLESLNEHNLLGVPLRSRVNSMEQLNALRRLSWQEAQLAHGMAIRSANRRPLAVHEGYGMRAASSSSNVNMVPRRTRALDDASLLLKMRQMDYEYRMKQKARLNARTRRDSKDVASVHDSSKHVNANEVQEGKIKCVVPPTKLRDQTDNAIVAEEDSAMERPLDSDSGISENTTGGDRQIQGDFGSKEVNPYPLERKEDELTYPLDSRTNNHIYQEDNNVTNKDSDTCSSLEDVTRGTSLEDSVTCATPDDGIMDQSSDDSVTCSSREDVTGCTSLEDSATCATTKDSVMDQSSDDSVTCISHAPRIASPEGATRTSRATQVKTGSKGSTDATNYMRTTQLDTQIERDLHFSADKQNEIIRDPIRYREMWINEINRDALTGSKMEKSESGKSNENDATTQDESTRKNDEAT